MEPAAPDSSGHDARAERQRIDTPIPGALCEAFLCFVVYALLGLPAPSQVLHGSIGVIYYTRDKIVVAADSRLTPGGIDGVPSDDGYKVTALDGRMVFISIGVVRHLRDGLSPGWDSTDLVRAAYAKIKSVSPPGPRSSCRNSQGVESFGRGQSQCGGSITTWTVAAIFKHFGAGGGIHSCLYCRLGRRW